jgi:hypothetical protein
MSRADVTQIVKVGGLPAFNFTQGKLGQTAGARIRQGGWPGTDAEPGKT